MGAIDRVREDHRGAVSDLIGLLKCGDDVEAALKLFETVRLPRTTRVQNVSWENLTRFHMPDGPAQVERDAAMTKGMTDWSYKHIAWLYGHDAAVLEPGPEAAGIPGH